MIDLSSFNWVQLIKKSDLPPNAKYLCLFLSTFMNMEQNIAWPSMKRISQETGLSIPTARKWLDYLNNHGWLIKKSAVRQVTTPGGPQLQNEYLINIPQREINDLLTQLKGGQTVDQRGVNESTKGGKQFSPNNNRITSNNNRARFQKPTIEEIRSYCRQRDNNIDPENFYYFYEAKNWKIGNSSMKDWKAAIITWEKRDKKTTPQQTDQFEGVI